MSRFSDSHNNIYKFEAKGRESLIPGGEGYLSTWASQRCFEHSPDYMNSSINVTFEMKDDFLEK